MYNFIGIFADVDLQKEESGDFQNFCRILCEDFEYLLSQTEPLIAKKDTKWRKSVPAKENIAITLRFLASGESYKSLYYLFKVSHQLISELVPEVCNAIIQVLRNIIKVNI